MITLVVAFLISIFSWQLFIFTLGIFAKVHPVPRETKIKIERGRGREQLTAAQLAILWTPLIWLMLVFPTLSTSPDQGGLSTASLLLMAAIAAWLIIFIYNLRFKG